MAQQLTRTASLLSQQTNIRQNIILEIEGIDLVFGAISVTKIPKYGDDIDYNDPGLLYGGVVRDPRSRDYISLDGTTNSLQQQIEVDKGGVGSSQNFTVSLIDKNQELTRIFAPGEVVPDLLGRNAFVYLNFEGGAHPEDSIPIVTGVITSTEALPGKWKLTIQHPEFLKRGELFIQRTAEVTAGVGPGDTTVTVDSTAGFIPPGDVLRSFIQINDELIEYTGISGNQFTGCTRGQLDTIAASHGVEDEVTSFYVLEGQALDLALKLMLSEPTNSDYASGIAATNFEFIDSATTVESGILFESGTRRRYGLEIGDLVSITGATEVSNNITEAPILAFQDNPLGEIIIVNASLAQETDSLAEASFKSQYNVLPEGQGDSLKPFHVDVARFRDLQEFFSASLPDYTLYIKDTIELGQFMAEELFFPQGFYQVPRKSRISVAITQPPLVVEELPELTDENLQRVDRNNIRRELTKFFYNTTAYKFDVDSITDKFKAGEVFVSEKSFGRINTTTRTLTIESSGLRDDGLTRLFIRRQARRFNDRYQFGSETIQVESNFNPGFNIELADIVLFGNANLQIPDIKNASRDFEPRLMEVIDKRFDIKQGKVRLKLLDTQQGIDDGRFGVVSPNSYIAAGSTTNLILVKRSFTTGEFDIEREKWRNFIGQELRIRNDDYSFDETVRLLAFDPNTSNGLIVSPPLSSAPPEDYLVDLPNYDNASNEQQLKQKAIHVFTNPIVEVVSGVSNTVFEVGASDIGLFWVGAPVRVHNADFTNNSTTDLFEDDARVESIDTGTNEITVDKSLGFVPQAGDEVDLIGFAGDEGTPYRYV